MMGGSETSPGAERRWPPTIVIGRPASGRYLRVELLQVLSIFSLVLVTTGSIAGVRWFLIHGVTWFEPLLLLSMTFVTGLGVTLGYHRLFCHRAFSARAPLAAAHGSRSIASITDTAIGLATRIRHGRAEPELPASSAGCSRAMLDG
jgi:stearoyl-CoA desaturase (delta-9 desaturase)